jgi:hypothetical protein
LKEILAVYLENNSNDLGLWHGRKLTQGAVLVWANPVNIIA